MTQLTRVELRRIFSRKIVHLSVLAILAVVVFLPSGRDSKEAARLRVVCTFLPNYVFARNVVGDTPGVNVRLLVSTDVGCPHNYVVTPADLKAVAQKLSRIDLSSEIGWNFSLQVFYGKIGAIGQQSLQYGAVVCCCSQM